jgi:hypothetical protein
LFNIARLAMAGFIGQDRHCKTDEGFAAWLGGQRDMAQVMKAIDLEHLKQHKARVCPTYDTARYWKMRHQTYYKMQLLEADTRKLVAKWWPAIVRVAEVLMSVRVIKGHKYLVDIIREAISR